MFRAEAGQLERRLWGADPVPNSVPNPAAFAMASNGPVAQPVVEPAKCRQFLGYGAAQESNLPTDGLRRLTGFEEPLDSALQTA
jgi:hypothetical protein